MLDLFSSVIGHFYNRTNSVWGLSYNTSASKRLIKYVQGTEYERLFGPPPNPSRFIALFLPRRSCELTPTLWNPVYFSVIAFRCDEFLPTRLKVGKNEWRASTDRVGDNSSWSRTPFTVPRSRCRLRASSFHVSSRIFLTIILATVHWSCGSRLMTVWFWMMNCFQRRRKTTKTSARTGGPWASGPQNTNQECHPNDFDVPWSGIKFFHPKLTRGGGRRSLMESKCFARVYWLETSFIAPDIFALQMPNCTEWEIIFHFVFREANADSRSL